MCYYPLHFSNVPKWLGREEAHHVLDVMAVERLTKMAQQALR